MDPQDTLQLNPQALARIASSLPAEALRVAVLFDGHRRLWEVLRDSPLSGRMTVPVVEQLMNVGVVGAVGVKVAPRHRQTGEVKSSRRETASPPQATAPTLRMPCPAPLPENDATAAEERVEGDAALEPQPEPWSDTMVLPRADLAQVELPPSPTPSSAFDEADEAFFESYQPEDEAIDTFWDLEDTPLARRRAQQRQQRMLSQHQSRGHSGGWLRSILGML